MLGARFGSFCAQQTLWCTFLAAIRPQVQQLQQGGTLPSLLACALLAPGGTAPQVAAVGGSARATGVHLRGAAQMFCVAKPWSSSGDPGPFGRLLVLARSLSWLPPPAKHSEGIPVEATPAPLLCEQKHTFFFARIPSFGHRECGKSRNAACRASTEDFAPTPPTIHVQEAKSRTTSVLETWKGSLPASVHPCKAKPAFATSGL